MLDFFSFWSTVTARVMKLYSRNALAHQLSEKPWFNLFHSNAETGNDPLSEELIAPIVLYIWPNFGQQECHILVLHPFRTPMPKPVMVPYFFLVEIFTFAF